MGGIYLADLSFIRSLSSFAGLSPTCIGTTEEILGGSTAVTARHSNKGANSYSEGPTATWKD